MRERERERERKRHSKMVEKCPREVLVKLLRPGIAPSDVYDRG